MGKYDKLLRNVLAGQSDANISFSDLRRLLIGMKFDERIKGDHHIFTKNGVDEILNLQPKGANAKPYQVKQVRNLIVTYKMGPQDAE